ncbi:MAG: hypothetical protein QXM81_05345, partial [Nitrososphaerota archaeon]
INAFLANLHAFLTEKKEEAGQTLVEYALIIALISLLVVGLADFMRAVGQLLRIALPLSGNPFQLILS